MRPEKDPSVRRWVRWHHAIAAVTAAVGIWISAMSVAGTVTARAFDRRAVTTEAEIARQHEDEFGDCYLVDVRFTSLDGHMHTARQVPFYDCPEHGAGSSVTIRYDPADPSRAQIDDEDPEVGLVFGPVLGALAVIPFRRARRRKAALETLARSARTIGSMRALLWESLRHLPGQTYWVSLSDQDGPEEPPVSSYPLIHRPGREVPAIAIAQVLRGRDGSLLAVIDGDACWPSGPVRSGEWHARSEVDRRDARLTLQAVELVEQGMRMPKLHEVDPGWGAIWRAFRREWLARRDSQLPPSRIEVIRIRFLLMAIPPFALAAFVAEERPSATAASAAVAALVVGASGIAAIVATAAIPRMRRGRASPDDLARSYSDRAVWRTAASYLPVVSAAVAWWIGRADAPTIAVGAGCWLVAYLRSAPTRGDVRRADAQARSDDPSASLLDGLLRRPPPDETAG